MTTILSVAYPFAPISSDPVGGAEQVLAHLDRAIAQRGWTSLVIACEGSSTVGELITVPSAAGEITPAARKRAHAAVKDALHTVAATRQVDLIHLHGIDFDAYLPAPGSPVLATLHLPIDWYGAAALTSERPLTWLQPVSASQARSAPPSLRLTEPIDNGVDVAAFEQLAIRKPRQRPFALALGRICPEKGFHLALDAARQAGVRMDLAGEVFAYPAHQAYFAEQIAPRLDADRRFVGPLGGARKREMMAEARCVLIPSLAPETSSLVAREAAAAGTPVIAFRQGALAETVEDGRTGWLVNDVDAMAEAIGKADEIDPQVCREVARVRFALKPMTDRYLGLYGRLIATAERSRAA